jgi:hypothetical protein
MDKQAMSNAMTIAREFMLTARLETTYHGLGRPAIEVRSRRRNASERRLRAVLHAIAAELELATPANECWHVEIACETESEVGLVYLALIDGDEGEAKRGMALLWRIVG